MLDPSAPTSCTRCGGEKHCAGGCDCDGASSVGRAVCIRSDAFFPFSALRAGMMLGCRLIGFGYFMGTGSSACEFEFVRLGQVLLLDGDRWLACGSGGMLDVVRGISALHFQTDCELVFHLNRLC